MRYFNLKPNVKIKANTSRLKVRINEVAKQGTEEYLLMLLTDESSNKPDGEVTIEDIEAYLDSNPDEAEFFDYETIVGLKNKINRYVSYLNQRVA